MEEKIKAIDLIHYLLGKTISSVRINDDVYANDKYSIVIKGEEYATFVEIILDDDLYPHGVRRIALYEALGISIENNIISFRVRSWSGIGPDDRIVFTV
ncbi:MAG: hypothetical protein LBC48_08040 [Dysgonamonadaceae bacterium]|jgi:hypothetical protein|nr:hypothetical protein [Dysgonamonadaceae bacterium]